MSRQEVKGVQMISTRTIATVTGVLFLITFITSIPAAFVFYPPLLTDPNYILERRAERVTTWHAEVWLDAPRPTSVSAW
jgi:hypothetical protein